MVHLILLHALCNEVSSARDALTLVRVWANQRGYAADSERMVAGFDSLSGNFWSFLLAYLVWGDEESSLTHTEGGKRRKGRRTIGKGLSSYQLFRAILDLLCEFALEPRCCAGWSDFGTISGFIISNS